MYLFYAEFKNKVFKGYLQFSRYQHLPGIHCSEKTTLLLYHNTAQSHMSAVKPTVSCFIM